MQQRIFDWSKRKAEVHGRLFKKDEDPVLYMRKVASFNDSSIAEFHKEFGAQLDEVTKKLKVCGADTKELESAIERLTRAVDAVGVAYRLRAAAYDVPDDDPKCSTKGVGDSGFKEKDTGIYTFVLGRTVLGLYKEQLQEPSNLLSLSGTTPFKAYIKDGKLYVDVRVYKEIVPNRESTRQLQFEVIRNHVTVSVPGWDKNYSDRAVEIVDSSQVPMFQMIFESERQIRINGIFPVGNNKINMVTPTEGGEKQIISGQQLVVPLKRIFRYPSWQFLGKYAEN